MTHDMDVKKKKKKSTDYSRRGCIQCKRSHLKCDEKFPTCSRCIKRNTKCSYFTNFLLESTDPNLDQNQKATSKTTIIWENNKDNTLHNTNKIPELILPRMNDPPTLIEPTLEEAHTSISSVSPIPTSINNTPTIAHFNHLPNDSSSSTNNNNNNINHNNSIASQTQTEVYSDPNTISPFAVPVTSPNKNKDKISPQDISNFVPSPSFLSNFNYKSPHSHNMSDSSEVGSQLSVSNIRLHDLISVEPDDLNYLNSLSKEYETMTYLYNEKIHPNLHSFDIPWDGGPLYYFVERIKENDPIVLNSSISLNDQAVIDFTWTMARVTKFFFTFVLYADTSLMSVLDLCFKLGTKSSIFQSVLTYHCAVHMVRVYNATNEPELASLWDFNVRIPSFKQCIDYLREGLENSPKFSDLVILTFAVAIIFSGNASDESWRAHLNGCYQLISKCSSLKKNVKHEDPFDSAALKLYDIIVEWYNHVSALAAISSTNGFLGKKLSVHASDSSTNIALASNGINLMAGHCSQISTVISKLYNFIYTFNKKGVKLFGLNFVHFILDDNSSVDTINEIREFGFELLHELKKIETNYKYKRLDLEDFRMDLSIKYCDLLYINGIQLFIKYFFIGIRESKEVRSMLREILDLVYSMPYRSSCAIICHWNIFMSAMISLLIQDYEIYGHFMGILRVFQMNGMDVNSMDILERIKLILLEKSYDKLLSHENDFVIY